MVIEENGLRLKKLILSLLGSLLVVGAMFASIAFFNGTTAHADTDMPSTELTQTTVLKDNVVLTTDAQGHKQLKIEDPDKLSQDLEVTNSTESVQQVQEAVNQANEQLSKKNSASTNSMDVS